MAGRARGAAVVGRVQPVDQTSFTRTPPLRENIPRTGAARTGALSESSGSGRDRDGIGRVEVGTVGTGRDGSCNQPLDSPAAEQFPDGSGVIGNAEPAARLRSNAVVLEGAVGPGMR